MGSAQSGHAVSAATSLLVVGDPEQLTSVQAGAVPADLSAVHKVCEQGGPIARQVVPAH